MLSFSVDFKFILVAVNYLMKLLLLLVDHQYLSQLVLILISCYVSEEDECGEPHHYLSFGPFGSKLVGLSLVDLGTTHKMLCNTFRFGDTCHEVGDSGLLESIVQFLSLMYVLLYNTMG